MGANPTESGDPRQWQRGNLRNPPAWNPELQQRYPFRHWMHDVLAWSQYTGLGDHQKGPALELVLDGRARELVREIPLEHKTRGAMYDAGDGQGVRHWPGLDFIMLAFSHNFAHLDEEEPSRQMIELWTFRRCPGESIHS